MPKLTHALAPLRAPLAQFFLIGGAFYAVVALTGAAPPPAPPDRIAVTQEDAARLAAQHEALWRRPPSPEELSALVERRIEEEVLVREARALGLEAGDSVVRQRLALKMRFVLEGGADAAAPDDAALQAHLEAHPDRFRKLGAVAFRQVPVTDADVADALAALKGGAAPEGVGRPGLLPGALGLTEARAVDARFGPGFFARIAALPKGEWTGPVDSAFGRHLVQVTELRPGALPPLARIRDAVERDWRQAEAERLVAARLAALKAGYEIARPEGMAPAQADGGEAAGVDAPEAGAPR